MGGQRGGGIKGPWDLLSLIQHYTTTSCIAKLTPNHITTSCIAKLTPNHITTSCIVKLTPNQHYNLMSVKVNTKSTLQPHV